MKSVGELVAAGSAYLARHRVDCPRVACELLASRLLHCQRLELFLRDRETPPEAVVDAWRRGLQRVAAGEPVQYVLGEWEFRRLTLAVDRRALIPRPETEQLVDLVLAAQELWQRPHPLVVDAGTGSGCIVLSLAAERPHGRYAATDTSAEALALARDNAARCGAAGVEFRQEPGCGAFPAGSVDAVVSNPPYIASGDIPGLARCIREHEPVAALDGGPDGLDAIRAIARDAAMVLRPAGRLFLEIGDDQGPAVRELLERLAFVQVDILPDLAGRTRFALARHGG